MASGFPIACVAGRETAFDGVAENRVVLAGTFNRNAACVRAALATVRTLREQPDLYRNAEEVGQGLMDGILSCAWDELIVQGLPPMFWIGFGKGEVLEASDLLRFDKQRTVEPSGDLVRRGVYVTTRGTWFVSGLQSHEDAKFAIAALASIVERSPEGTNRSPTDSRR